ncbi:hypothetical protein N5F23_07005 [Pseudomonas sichuanensis]|uniref:hypothetical protein n=1 Tax=Pseudomonas sichuanensis TaxID=2213015 RepID=UPI002446B9FA|nr:hypothetical protein [Pseudomonas sichuanensis]MDH0730275.1 hypothetical protein [Pseudomonas sichuanensis]MDH1582339.1 hypothetical protein [Pseudomonas sichuanensis]MDH1591736.1 hypothetical protein [Pseudomonas sichuanensis]MDH1599533.1 hypothetical protein [Pseudomonas sichuanensis]
MRKVKATSEQEHSIETEELISESEIPKDNPLVIALFLTLGLISTSLELLAWAGPQRVIAWAQHI